jgi:hypothetical protein
MVLGASTRAIASASANNPAELSRCDVIVLSPCIDVHIGFLSGVLRLMLRARGDESL